MKGKARIFIMSHLSDAQQLAITGGSPVLINDHINFAKWLLIKFPDTNAECDPDKEYELYQKRGQ